MKKLLIALALPLWVISAHAQFTTYGSTDPQSIDAGYVSDYSASGTVVMAGGSVTLANNATYEHGNLSFQNNGNWSSLTGSLDLFAAAGAVTISGTTAPGFLNLDFQNGAAVSVTNTGGANIAGQLLFGTGTIVSTVRASHSNGALRFADNATYTGGTSDAQHVNGYVSKTGNDGFTFPVGSGSDQRTLSISAPATVTNQYSVAWMAGDPGTNGDPSNADAMHPTNAVTAPVASVSTAGQWDWIPVSGTGAGLTITVSIPNLSPTGVLATDIRLVGWNGTSWVNLSSGPTAATGTTEGTTLAGTMIAGITAIGIGSTSTPLPVHFSAFNAYAGQCSVQLNWSTAMEINNDYFTVERSRDGRVFIGITTVQSTGNSTEHQEYAYTDKHPENGLNYYRIQQADLDGKHTATKVQQVYVHCNGDDAIKVFPTVSNSSVRVILPPGYEDATVELLTTLGQVVKVPIEGSNLSYSIHVDRLAAAMYVVRIRKGAALHSYKIIKGE